MSILDIFPRGGDPSTGSDAFIQGDALIIDCRTCRFFPSPASNGCISCMTEAMVLAGSSDRIVLRTGRDTEVSGRAGRMIKEAASLRRWSVPDEAECLRCRGCPVSRRAIMLRAWSCFPGPTDPSIRASLVSEAPDREGCPECVSRTMRSLEQMERGIAAIADSARRGRRCQD